MKVTAIIPCFNGRHFLDDALSSIEAQTRPVDELLLVDDGSSDGTLEFLREYERRSVLNVRVIGQENGGSAEARNTGVENSTGDLVAFIDQDDAWLPEKVARQVAIFESEPDVGVVYTDAFLVNERLEVLPGGSYLSRRSPAEGKVLDALLIQGDFVPNPSAMVRKRFLPGSRPFVQRFFPCDDYDFYLRLAAVCTFRLINEPLVKYRLHPAQESRKVDLGGASFGVLVERLADGSLGPDYSPEAARSGLRRCLRGHTKRLLRNGRYDEALGLINQHLPHDTGTRRWLWWTWLRLRLKGFLVAGK